MVKRGEGLSRRAEYRSVLCGSSASVDAMTRRVHDVQSRYDTAGSVRIVRGCVVGLTLFFLTRILWALDLAIQEERK